MHGWRAGGWGYLNDNGFLEAGYNHKVAAGPVYGAGQVVGVAYDPTSKRLWFTLDGNKFSEFSQI
jgi:hypothetical protein